jgi:hypothetical protein
MRLVLLLVSCLVLGLPVAVGSALDVPPEKAREMLKLLTGPELQRPQWRRQIEKSCDRVQSFAITQPGAQIITGPAFLPYSTISTTTTRPG